MEERQSDQVPRANRSEYQGWLVSDSLVKRSLAVVGHQIVGQLIIFFVLFIPLLLLALLFGSST